jgi:multimeric flavodoxin WrbA
MRLVVINGSPRCETVSNTFKALKAYTDYLKKCEFYFEDRYHQLPNGLKDCLGCTKCTLNCIQEDEMQNIIKDIDWATHVMIGTPVYHDMPTAQTFAFLHRLNCMAENTKRSFFRGKKALLVATAFCSGAKSAIHAMMANCEMLGFDIDGRSSREYIVKWSDAKLRGGMTPDDSIFLNEKKDQ